jgi:hypothetical protein
LACAVIADNSGHLRQFTLAEDFVYPAALRDSIQLSDPKPELDLRAPAEGKTGSYDLKGSGLELPS